MQLQSGRPVAHGEKLLTPVATEPLALRLPYSKENWNKVQNLTVSRPVNPQNTGITPSVVITGSTAPPNIAPNLPIVGNSSGTTGAVDNPIWIWPVKGTVLQNYTEGSVNKGIDIDGVRGEPVLAAQSGRIVYSGNGLRGYGNLLIIKHNNDYLTAYAHNQKLLVKEGEWVKQGQKIAEMGDSGSDRIKLHFEVRRFGKPLDPVLVLPKKTN